MWWWWGQGARGCAAPCNWRGPGWTSFYGVDSTYATAARPAYAARGGYSGSQFTVALSKRFSGFWVGAFARHDNLDGAVFADSPLMRRSQNLSLGLGIAWILGQSSRMVDSHE